MKVNLKKIPSIGDERIKVTFIAESDEDREILREILDRRVDATGRIDFEPNLKKPYKQNVQELDIHFVFSDSSPKTNPELNLCATGRCHHRSC